MASIKVVDFTSFIDGSDKQRVADEMLSAFKSTGFVYLTNHGMSEDRVQKIFTWVGDHGQIRDTLCLSGQETVKAILFAIHGSQTTCTSSSIWDSP
jgi:hypothetical protein